MSPHNPSPGGSPASDFESPLRDDVLPEAPPTEPAFPRRCYAAAHVAVSGTYASVPHTPESPGTPAELFSAVDWDTTLALRTRLDRLGFGIAEAMDTAQRFEFGWTVARELIERTGALGLRNGFVAGAAIDHANPPCEVGAIADALLWQVHFVHENGGIPVILPQPCLTEGGAEPEDYVDLYLRVADGAPGPVLLHWLGEAFHPAMRGYFPGDTARRILAARPDVFRGIKLSLLDRPFEEALRAELAPRGQVVFTGDDLNFSGLIEGEAGPSTGSGDLGGRPLDVGPYSHALLGVFDAIARPASVALTRLGRGDVEGYREVMQPCEELGRALFEAPTSHYKAGVAFLAWLGGLQPNRMLANHLEDARSLEHYLRVADLASRAGVFEDAALANERLAAFVAAHGAGAARGK